MRQFEAGWREIPGGLGGSVCGSLRNSAPYSINRVAPYYMDTKANKSLKNICVCGVGALQSINSLRPRHNGRHFPDDTFKRIFLNENIRISIKISPNFVPKGQINKCQSFVQMMAWRRPGDKPLSEPMMVRLLTHICVTRLRCYIRSQLVWVNRKGTSKLHNTNPLRGESTGEGWIPLITASKAERRPISWRLCRCCLSCRIKPFVLEKASDIISS